MQLKIRFLCLIFTGLSANSIASDVVSGPVEWEPWKIDLQEGYCELQMWHRAVEPPFYPNVMFRFHVSVRSRDGRSDSSPDFEGGRLYFWLYNYLPNVPQDNRPLHRIESAVLDGRTLSRRQDAALAANDHIYRVFELGSDDTVATLESLSNVHYLRGTVDLTLTLSNGEIVVKKVRPGHFFRTQARMLSVCMQEGFMH